MSVTQEIKQTISRFPSGKPFSNKRLLRLGNRAAVDKALSRFVAKGTIKRLTSGLFVRPKKNRYIGEVAPSVSSIINTLAKEQNEILQVHGAEAARRFKLSTQVPTQPVYYTNGSSREIHIGQLKITLMHTSSRRKLQHAGKKEGLALMALWYLGKQNINDTAITKVRQALSAEEFTRLCASDMPAWLAKAMEHYKRYETHV